MKYFHIVFKNASERVINACRGFDSLMGIYECVVFTNFAALKMKNIQSGILGVKKGITLYFKSNIFR